MFDNVKYTTSDAFVNSKSVALEGSSVFEGDVLIDHP